MGNYKEMELWIELSGSILPSCEDMDNNKGEISIWFDGLRIKTPKGEFDLYERNDCDVEYHFFNDDGRLICSYTIKGVGYYDVKDEERDFDKELNVSVEDMFTGKEEDVEIIEIAMSISVEKDGKYIDDVSEDDVGVAVMFKLSEFKADGACATATSGLQQPERI